MKEKIRNNSNINNVKQYSETLINPCLYEVNKHNGVINVVNNTKNNEIPSIPKEIINWYIYSIKVLKKSIFKILLWLSLKINW